MPALPWTTIRPADAVEADRTYVGFVSKLPLTAHRHVPGFLRDAGRVRRQLAAAPGLVGYSLLAELVAKTFWTVSVWDDEAALRAFAVADPHRAITRRVPARMAASGFHTFEVRGAELPLRWPASKDRLS
jgi:heme-degrading monooxygenase HmoA